LPTLDEAGSPASPGPAFCSIIAKNYLAQARALTRSLLRQHPGVPVYVLVVDEAEGWIQPWREKFTFVPLHALDLPSPCELRFRYELLELCTAVKPFYLRWLFGRGHSKLVFLDPDVWVYRPLDQLLGMLDDWDVILTPHLTARVDDGKYPDERLMLLVGAYNLGFLGLARGPEVDRLLDWWWTRCQNECLFELERGLFLDQKWMNLAPGMLDRVLVLRHPGYNVAHWNLNHRRIEGSPDAPFVNGEPLHFLHCSSVDPLDPPRLACPQNRYVRLDDQPLLSMLQDYSAELLAGGYQVCSRWPYSNGNFEDGHPIDREMRRLFRSLPPGRFPDPFRTGSDTFLHWAVTPVTERPGARTPPFDRAPGSEIPEEAPSPPPSGKELGPAGVTDHGATVIGYLCAESGMGELVRSAVRALQEVSYPLNVLELRDAAHRHSDLSIHAPVARERLPFTLVILTAPDAERERGQIGLPSSRGYTIGYWPWELEVFPDDLRSAFVGFDEIWALSRFSAAAIGGASPVPVHTVWPALPDVGWPGKPPRERILDPGEYNLLFIYDLLSETDRKNPMDLIAAFRGAFRKDDRAHLTIKTINGQMRKDELRLVIDAAAGLPVTVCDRYLARPDLLGLLRSCDCYVSLHRTEGFGFTLAEAMALAKPVIATFYSGNTDYMTPWNCFPVPYRMGEIRVRRGAYPEGYAWAAPDVEAAAALMRKAYREPDLAAEVGARARADITRLLSVRACGERMIRRLEAIAGSRASRADVAGLRDVR
jgi:glycosyltransferase involved in cell wall biosynthesis